MARNSSGSHGVANKTNFVTQTPAEVENAYKNTNHAITIQLQAVIGTNGTC